MATSVDVFCGRVLGLLRRRCPGMAAVLEAVTRAEAGSDPCRLALLDPLRLRRVLERRYGAGLASRIMRDILAPCLAEAAGREEAAGAVAEALMGGDAEGLRRLLGVAPAAAPGAPTGGPGAAKGELGVVLRCLRLVEEETAKLYEEMSTLVGEPCRTALGYVAAESRNHARVVAMLEELLGTGGGGAAECRQVQLLQGLRRRLREEAAAALPGVLRVLAGLEREIGEEEYARIVAGGAADLLPGALGDVGELVRSLLEAVSSDEEHHAVLAGEVLRLVEAGRCRLAGGR